MTCFCICAACFKQEAAYLRAQQARSEQSYAYFKHKYHLMSLALSRKVLKIWTTPDLVMLIPSFSVILAANSR
jgi:hypothetical protein